LWQRLTRWWDHRRGLEGITNKKITFNTEIQVFYADDTVTYCCASSLTKGSQNLQTDFYTVQHTLCQLTLILITDKTKLILFSKARNRPLNLSPIITCQGKEIETVTSYKYLGILIDDSLYFTLHI
jgi:hypothetical protein